MQSAMQCDVDPDISIVQEDDQDSLFGSPPSSPVRGRSPSPALALPSARNSTQNVGTIALPGSQHYSELPVTPLALSLTFAQNEPCQRPPAFCPTAIPSNISTPASSSRASSAAPSARPKKRTTKKATSQQSTPRPPPIEIPLPDPSAPVPANFLRNQSALLGTAGLVGGVKPANLSVHRPSRGSDASNPIVIDDEEQSVTSQLTSSKPYPKPIDPNLLPTPSTQDIVSMLIGQKDIFPVLESLLKLIAGANKGILPPPPNTSIPAPLTSFRRTPQSFQPSVTPSSSAAGSRPASSSSTGPPPKRRRLNRVPAGAVDWDVPFPFPEGQGPEAYRTNWERERGKQLISQLVSLIKGAAQKAATKLYYQKHQFDEQQPGLMGVAEEPKVHRHYRPSTATYGMQGEQAAAARAQVQEVLTDASNGNKKPAASSVPNPSPQQSFPPSSSSVPVASPQPSTPFDRLISSLLAAAPEETAAANNCTPPSNEATAAVSADVKSVDAMKGPAENLDQGLFDNWMNVLQTFPAPAKDFSSSTHDMWGLPSQPDASASTQTDNDFGLFNFNQTFNDSNPVDTESFDYSSLFDSAEAPASTPTSTPTSTAQTSDRTEAPAFQNNTATFSSGNVDIDPILLALSMPQQSAVPTSAEASPSPMPSLSSLGDAGPATPNSATWDLSAAEVFTGVGTGEGSGSGSNNGVVGRGVVDQGGAEEHLNLNALLGTKNGTEDKERDVGFSVHGHGHGRVPPLLLSTAGRTKLDLAEFSVSSPIPSTLTTHAAPLPVPVPAPSALVSNKAAKSQSNKIDIVNRAMERKKQLLAEINSVRTQLWETTIEQGVLSHMNRLCSTNTT